VDLVVLPHVFRDVLPLDQASASRDCRPPRAQARISFAEEAEDCEQGWPKLPGWAYLGAGTSGRGHGGELAAAQALKNTSRTVVTGGVIVRALTFLRMGWMFSLWNATASWL